MPAEGLLCGQDFQLMVLANTMLAYIFVYYVDFSSGKLTINVI